MVSRMTKTSLALDRDKVAEAKRILGTRTIAATVDTALDEVIRLAQRKRILERIRRSERGGIGPSPHELEHLREP